MQERFGQIAQSTRPLDSLGMSPVQVYDDDEPWMKAVDN